MEHDDVCILIFALQRAILYETYISPNHLLELDGNEKKHLEGYQQLRMKLFAIIESYNDRYMKKDIPYFGEKGLLEWEAVDEDTRNDNGKGREC